MSEANTTSDETPGLPVEAVGAVVEALEEATATDATIGLVGFPNLLDHMISRILADYPLTLVRLDYDHASKEICKFPFTFFFWPDKGDQGAHRIKQLSSCPDRRRSPIAIVSNPIGQVSAQPFIGKYAERLLLTPLRPHEVTECIEKFTGLKDEKVAKAVSVDYVNSLIRQTLRVLEETTGLNCDRSNMKLSTEAMTSGHVTGTVSFSGSATGFITASFPKNLATKIACKTMSVRGECITDIEIGTSIAELIDSVATAARETGDDLKEHLQISAPQVFSGGPHLVTQLRGVPIFVFEFRAADEMFTLFINFKRKSN